MSLKDAVGGHGWIVAAAGIVLSIAAFFGGEQAKPIENVVEPVAQSVSVSCYGHEGWENTSIEADHALVISCTRDGWIVILAPDKSFSHALNPAGNAFEFDPAKVPNW